MATGVAVRCRRDARCRQCTGKRLSRAIWSSFNKETMSHLCDSTVAGPTARRDNALASKCEYPPFRYPPFKCALNLRLMDSSAFRLDIFETPVTVTPQKKNSKTFNSLDGGNSALVIGFSSRPNFRFRKHYFLRLFGALKMASTKARLLKHDFPVHEIL